MIAAMNTLPKWAIFHVPHDATLIPDEVMAQFALNEDELTSEIVKMSDHCTFELFASGVPAAQVVRAPVSRLVVDVERFEDDRLEPMAGRGMGAVYTQTHDGRALRHAIRAPERQVLMDAWYRPHHEALALATDRVLGHYGRALVIDAHSFPKLPLQYEVDQCRDRPEICIGTDEFHTPKALESCLMNAFKDAGFTVRLNSPFAGALVPQLFYKRDRRVSAAMVEVRRDLYIEEKTGKPNEGFNHIREEIRNCLVIALGAEDRA